MDDLYNDEHDEDDLPVTSATRFVPPLGKRVSNEPRRDADNDLLDRFQRPASPSKAMQSKTSPSSLFCSSSLSENFQQVGKIFIKQVFDRSKTTMKTIIRIVCQDDKK